MPVSPDRDHWDRVYCEKRRDQVSWYEAVPATSLAMIEALDLRRDRPILDVGGGASRLAAELLGRGFTDVTVTDISAAALERAREDCPDPERVDWVVADVRDHDFGRRFGLWHDRAVLHFMVGPEDRAGYLATLERSVEPGGHVIVSTFGPEGPTRCSGLPTERYGADDLVATFGDLARVVSSHLEEHRTPSGTVQQFIYAHLVREG